MFVGKKSSSKCVALFHMAPASTHHQVLSMVAHGGMALAIVAMVTIKGIIVMKGGAKEAVWLAKVKVESKKFGLLSHGGCSGVD